MWVAWNLKGAPDLKTYLALPSFDREILKSELEGMIEEHNEQFED